MYLFERQSYREKRNLCSHWLTPQITSTAKAGPEPAAQHSFWVSDMCGRGFSTWGIFCCFPRYISKEQELEQRGLELVLQVTAELVVPQHWPSEYHFQENPFSQHL